MRSYFRLVKALRHQHLLAKIDRQYVVTLLDFNPPRGWLWRVDRIMRAKSGGRLALGMRRRRTAVAER